MLNIRLAEKSDLKPLCALYTCLHDNPMPRFDEKLETLWGDILADSNHKVVVGEYAGRIVSSLILIIVPNLTHNQRPYALIENVVTRGDSRGRGFASALLGFARDIAIDKNCYKIMLLTGAKDLKTLNFYEKAGYNSTDKTAFIQWLN